MPFSKLELSTTLQALIKKNNYTKPILIQNLCTKGYL